MGFLTLLELVNIPFCHAFLPLLNVTIQKKIEWGIQNIPILLLDGWVSYEETAMFQNWCWMVSEQKCFQPQIGHTCQSPCGIKSLFLSFLQLHTICNCGVFVPFECAYRESTNQVQVLHKAGFLDTFNCQIFDICCLYTMKYLTMITF